MDGRWAVNYTINSTYLCFRNRWQHAGWSSVGQGLAHHTFTHRSSQPSGRKATVMAAEDKGRPGTANKQWQSDKPTNRPTCVCAHTHAHGGVSVEWLMVLLNQKEELVLLQTVSTHIGCIAITLTVFIVTISESFHGNFHKLSSFF